MAAFALVAGLLVGIVAGLGGGTVDNSAATSVPTTSPTTTTPVTLPDEDFLRISAGISDLIAAAGGQRCPLVSAFSGFRELPTPSNPTQVEAAVGVTLEILRASAASALEDQPGQATTIAATADELEAEAAAQGYEPDWLNTAPGNVALSNEEFQTAFEQYQQLTDELCFPDEAEG